MGESSTWKTSYDLLGRDVYLEEDMHNGERYIESYQWERNVSNLCHSYECKKAQMENCSDELQIWLMKRIWKEDDTAAVTDLVFMELDVFHLCCHQCQRRRLLAIWLSSWDVVVIYGNIYHFLEKAWCEDQGTTIILRKLSKYQLFYLANRYNFDMCSWQRHYWHVRTQVWTEQNVRMTWSRSQVNTDNMEEVITVLPITVVYRKNRAWQETINCELRN